MDSHGPLRGQRSEPPDLYAKTILHRRSINVYCTMWERVDKWVAFDGGVEVKNGDLMNSSQDKCKL
jgi:hypothetical protein